MIESRIEQFQHGRKILNEMMRDYMHPEEPLYHPSVHDTRINGFRGIYTWEALGYIFGVVENCFKHPKTVYEILILKK